MVPSGAAAWTWAASTSDVRALQKTTSASDRVAATWYTSSAPFTIAVTPGDTAVHRVTLYAVDWDRFGRSQRIEYELTRPAQW